MDDATNCCRRALSSLIWLRVEEGSLICDSLVCCPPPPVCAGIDMRHMPHAPQTQLSSFGFLKNRHIFFMPCDCHGHSNFGLSSPTDQTVDVDLLSAVDVLSDCNWLLFFKLFEPHRPSHLNPFTRRENQQENHFLERVSAVGEH